MDALGLFSSGLFSGYTIIWAGGGHIAGSASTSVVNGSFLIITSAVLGSTKGDVTLIGNVVVKNNSTAYGGGIGRSSGNGESICALEIGFKYEGSSVTNASSNSTTHLFWSGIIVA